MSIDDVPKDARQAQEPGNSNPTAAQRAVAIALATVILVLPIDYLVQHHRPSSNVSAESLAPAAPRPVPSLAQLQAAEQASPTVANRLDLSAAYINSQKAVRAIPLLESIVAEDANNAIAWNNLCAAHTMQLEFNLALDACHHALRIAPDFQMAKNNLKWTEDERLKTVAAVTTAELAAPASRTADSYLAEGLNNLHLGNYDQAIKAWRRALDLSPRNALAANNIGSAYMAKKQPSAAIPWFEKAIAFDPNLQIAKNNLAWAKDEQAKSRK